jgi:PP-loop superfamily ATP-utilizing enzyme
LADTIQYIVSLVHRIERNYTVMQIANFNLEREKESIFHSSSSSNSTTSSQETLQLSSLRFGENYTSEMLPSFGEMEFASPGSANKRVRFSSEDSVSLFELEEEEQQQQWQEEQVQEQFAQHYEIMKNMNNKN